MKNNNLLTIESKGSVARRAVAMLCIACMVVLQCFVILPAVTEEAHAAGDLSIDMEYQDDAGTYARQTVSESWLKGINNTNQMTVVDEEGHEITFEGPTVKGILDEAGASSKVSSVSVGGVEVSKSNEDYFLAIYDGSYYLCNARKGEVLAEDVGDVFIQRSSGVKPISFNKSPKASNSNPNVGDTIKITYSLSIDSFFKKSDDYKSDPDAYTTLTWTGDSKVRLLSDTTSGKSGSLKAKVKKSGSITITPDSAMFPELTDGVKVSFNGQTTTTTTKYTTRHTTRYTTRYTVSPYRPTARTGATISRPSGTTSMTTATRPGETGSTSAPSFQTIKVKEVFLTPAGQGGQDDVTLYDENGNPIDEDESESESENENTSSGVTFPAAAGSAAVAAAAAGAGAVGRVRRFRHDMGPAAIAAAKTKTAPAGKGSAGGAKESRNPLKKFRK